MGVGVRSYFGKASGCLEDKLMSQHVKHVCVFLVLCVPVMSHLWLSFWAYSELSTGRLL